MSKRTQSKGFMLAILLLCLFSFSGHSVYPSHPHITKTELVISFRHVRERANFFKTFFSSTSHRTSFAFNVFDIKAALLHLARQEKVKFNITSNEVLFFKSETRFYGQLHSPHYSNEDDLIFPRG